MGSKKKKERKLGDVVLRDLKFVSQKIVEGIHNEYLKRLTVSFTLCCCAICGHRYVLEQRSSQQDVTSYKDGSTNETL